MAPTPQPTIREPREALSRLAMTFGLIPEFDAPGAYRETIKLLDETDAKLKAIIEKAKERKA